MDETAPETPAFPPPDIVLHRPQLGENIGASARAMRNFGLTRLHIVSPRSGWSPAKARAAAAGGAPLLDSMTRHETLKEALSPFGFVLASSARPRALAKPVYAPAEALRILRSMSGKAKTAILFGPERSGLSNADLDLSDAIVTIPAESVFSSLNLAQSVLLLSWLWHDAAHDRPPPRPSQPPQPPATKEEMMALFTHMETELEKALYFRPPERREVMVRNLRALIQRCAPSSPEVRALRGVITALARDGDKG